MPYGMEEDSKVMPTGAMIPPVEDDLPEELGEGEGEGTKAEAGAKAEQPPLILGKFKSVEDLAKSYQELESMAGRQSSEVGDLRRQMDMIQQQLAAGADKGKAESKEAAEPDFDTQLKEIEEQVESGDLSWSQAIRMSAEITAKRTAAEAQKAFQQYDQQKQIQSQQDKFLQDHPDFLEAQKNGTLQQYKQTNPFHDDFSAYWHWKADTQAAEKEALAKEAFEKGKQEVSQLAKGSEAAKKVLAKPGSDIRKTQATGKRLSPHEIKQSMLSRIEGT